MKRYRVHISKELAVAWSDRVIMQYYRPLHFYGIHPSACLTTDMLRLC